jgi:hypothetical protein
MVIELQRTKQEKLPSRTSPQKTLCCNVIAFDVENKKRADKKVLTSIMNRANRLNW